ncbi:SDR family oxidoreductase [Nocardia sp. NPDC049707]|uniref:SDR family oxidoreductase n=1 Tax=Nocardia sp. NPDC049707 TaxID=3154735 RepID=UPI00343734A1
MEIRGSIALVTGANRGIGRELARALVNHGAAKVYAGARDPASVTDRDLTPVRLDVTDPDQVAKAAAQAGDVNIVVNNAGITGDNVTLLDGDLRLVQKALDVNFFGTWSVSRAFAPILARNGGGAMVNMVSVVAWGGWPLFPGYAASKAAEWSLTNSLREGLREQGTLVVGVHASFVDTDLVANFDVPKIAQGDVVELIVAALLRNESEVLADEATRQTKASLSHIVQS